MEAVRIIKKVNNLEIIEKLLNSVAKQCDCRVAYNEQTGVLNFYGDTSCKQYIAEQTLSFFRNP
jgi:hypothetical protein